MCRRWTKNFQMKEDTVLSDRIDLCRIFIFFFSECMCEFNHYGKRTYTDKFGLDILYFLQYFSNYYSGFFKNFT